MKPYIIFTNEQRPRNRSFYQNENRFKTYRANTKDEILDIKMRVERAGFRVTDIRTSLGYRVEI